MHHARSTAALLILAALAPSCLSDGPGGPRNPAGTLQFSAPTYSIGEAGGTATFTVRRIGGSTGTVSVLYTIAAGTATVVVDFTVPPSTGMLIWSDGDSADKPLTVDIVSDSDQEANETVIATIHTPSGGAALGTPSTATLTIVDDDSASPAGTLKFDPGTYSFYEAVPPLALIVPNEVIVTRVGGTAGAVSVMVVVSGGTATKDVDYRVPIPGPLAGVLLSWSDGESGPKRFTVDVIDDTQTEGDETILFALTNQTGGALLGSPNQATVTILDDE